MEQLLPKKISRIERIKLKYFLLGLLVIPTSLHMIGLASSYAMGIMLLSGIILLFELVSRNLRLSWNAVILTCALAVFVMLHLLLVTLFGSSDNIAISRALFSLSLLILLILSVDISARQALSAPPEAFDRLIRLLGLFLIALGFLSLVYGGIVTNLLGLVAPIPPFAEPSQFTLALVPFAIYGFAMRDFRSTVAFLAIIPLMILEIKNLTFIFIVVMMVMLRLPRAVLAVIIPVLALGGSYFYSQIQSALIAFELTYYLDRISFEESQNLSVLVYQQGIDIIESAIFGEKQLGVGFQQLGLVGLNFESTDRIRDILAGDALNTKDGGFVAAKLFGEFGLLAFGLMTLLSVMIVKAFNQVHKHFNRVHQLSPQILFANCCVMGYLIELSVRGMGYFSIGGSLMIFSILVLGRKHAVAPNPAFPK